MSGSIVVNSREQLLSMINNARGDRPRTPGVASKGKVCPNCQQKIYPVMIKGVERWMGCACSTGRAHHRI